VLLLFVQSTVSAFRFFAGDIFLFQAGVLLVGEPLGFTLVERMYAWVEGGTRHHAKSRRGKVVNTRSMQVLSLYRSPHSLRT